jgi:hypothetical protein
MTLDRKANRREHPSFFEQTGVASQEDPEGLRQESQ